MDRQDKAIREAIATMEILKSEYEKQAKPRAPLKSLRYSFYVTILHLEKRLRREPLKREEEHVIKYFCPSCQRYLGQRGKRCVIIFNKETYCQREGCGQALNWTKER